MRWLHDAMRKVVSKYKELKKEKAALARLHKGVAFGRNVEKVVSGVALFRGKERDDIRSVAIESKPIDSIDSYYIDSASFQSWTGITKNGTEQESGLQEKVKAIIQTLDAFDLLEAMLDEERDALFEAISKIVSA